MKTRNRLFLTAALGCAVLASAPAIGQTEKELPKPPTQPTPTDKQPQPAKPSPTDKRQPITPPKEPGARPTTGTADFQKLAALVGEWTASTKLKMQPDMEPIVSRATTKNTLILGDRYLQSETTGQMQGREIHTLEIFAYNTGAKRFEQSWMDSRTTGITQLRGTYDSAADAITFTGEIEDPATGKVVGDRAVMRFVDDKTYVIEVFSKAQDGREYVRLETTYRRARATPDKETPKTPEPTPKTTPSTTDKPPTGK